MEKAAYIYIVTNLKNTVLYTGVTTDLKVRIWQHKDKQVEGFTKKYNLTKLVYYEIFGSIEDAIAREKQIKKFKRDKKIKMIAGFNPSWEELYYAL